MGKPAMVLNVDPKLKLLLALVPFESMTLAEVRKLTGLTESVLAEAIAALTSVLPELETPPGALKLSGNVDLLNPEALCKHWPEELVARISKTGVYAVCESTNSEVINMGSPWPRQINVALSEYQSGGRGRRGRVWTSGFAGGLCLTVAFRLDKGRVVMPTLTLAIGARLASIVDRHLSVRTLLKWPNDLILADGKLGGILVELSSLDQGDQLLRIGVGVNCVAPATDTMSGEIAALPPAALAEYAKHSIDRTQLAAELVAGIVDACDRHSEHGFDAFRPSWQSRDYLKHQSVQVFDDERVRHGTAIGIDRDGALRVSTDEGELKLMGGEVRVRRR